VNREPGGPRRLAPRPGDQTRTNPLEEKMANTVIGSSIVIDGEIEGEEDLVVQGTVKGKIVLKENLIVENSGVVEADIQTTNVTVSGQVTGNIIASERVELKTDGRMVGDIKSPRILIADGASFKGNVDMDV
jgi:cytoskeletal protein CcmA (bactofilin family)